MSNIKIVVSQETCTQCGACLALCTARVYGRIDGRVEPVAPEACWLCGHCVAACPDDAIRHSGYPTEACPPLDPATLPSLDSLVVALRARRSTRVFRDQAVPRDVVQQLTGIARWVPSAGNGQPVDWLVFDDPARIAALSAGMVAVLAGTARLLRNPLLRPLLMLALGPENVKKGLESAEGFERLAQKLAQGEDPIFRRAPVVLVAHVPDGSYFGRDDAVYAAYSLMLAAERMGLGTCHIGYFHIALDRSRRLRQALGLPEGRRAEVTLALGYPQHPFHRHPSRRQPNLAWNAG